MLAEDTTVGHSAGGQPHDVAGAPEDALLAGSRAFASHSVS